MSIIDNVMPDLPNFFSNFNDLLKLAQDEYFRKFLLNPKVQALMKDKEFEKAVKEKNISKLVSHPEFSEVLKDPEIASALEQMRLNFQKKS